MYCVKGIILRESIHCPVVGVAESCCTVGMRTRGYGATQNKFANWQLTPTGHEAASLTTLMSSIAVSEAIF